MLTEHKEIEKHLLTAKAVSRCFLHMKCVNLRFFCLLRPNIVAHKEEGDKRGEAAGDLFGVELSSRAPSVMLVVTMVGSFAPRRLFSRL
jgi:hypothetical protein